MIPAFDLKIGNWVTASGIMYCITAVSETKVNFKGLKGAVKQEDLHPIQLTQEVLERAGFARLKKTDMYEKIPLEGFTYKLYANRVMIFHPGDNMFYHWLNTQIVFLHQLQNLYYCLTGREIVFDGYHI